MFDKFYTHQMEVVIYAFDQTLLGFEDITSD